jgi:hypothetical protein
LGSPNIYPGAPTSYVPETGLTLPTTSPDASELLKKLAYPELHGNEGDAASEESAKTARPLTEKDTIIVIPLGTTTPTLIPLRQSTTSPDLAYVSPTYKTPGTFGSAAPAPSPVFASEPTVSPIARIFDAIRAILAGFMRILSAEVAR